jgi:hypothetical protein
MMRWNREAAMLGIPDLPEEGFKHVGDRKIKPQGGGGSPGTQTVEQTNVPSYLRPQFEDMMGRGVALSQKEYQPYGGERTAGFTQMQQDAFDRAGQQGVASQIGQATGLAGLAAQQGLQAGQFQTGRFDPMSVQAPSLQQFQMGPAMQVGSQQVGTQGIQAAQTGFNPMLERFQMGPAQTVSSRDVGTQGIEAAQTGFRPDLQQFQMEGPQSFAQPGAAEQFMSPYMQNVVDVQKREAQRQADIEGTQRGAQAVRAGAFGGSRQAIMDAEAQRNLAQQMGDIQATGSQAAFQQAQAQFNQEQQARQAAEQANLQARLGIQELGTQTGLQTSLANLSADQQTRVQNEASRLQAQGMNQEAALRSALANQQAGLTVSQENLRAAMGTQELGTQAGLQTALANLSNDQQARVQSEANRLQAQGMNQDAALRSALANQQAGLTVGQQNLGALLGIQQLGTGQSMEAQRANQQALADAQRAFEQSRQFGADLGLRGGAQALQGAQVLGGLGQQQFGQQMDITGMQRDIGREQQAQQQRIFDQQYGDFQAQRDFDYQQLGFLSDMLRGTGSSTRSIYQPAQPGFAQTAVGLGTAAAGFGGFGRAKGGEVKRYANGGITGLLDDQQLAQTAQNADQGPMMQLAAAEEAQQRDMIRSAVPADMPRETDMTEQELLAALQQAIREGNQTKARVIAELIEERKMPESGIAAIASDDIGDMPEGGLIGMAYGGEVQRFYGGGMPLSPMDLTEEEFQQRLLEEQEMQSGRGLMAAPTAEQMAAAHQANPRMMAGLPALKQIDDTPPADGSVSGGGVMAPAELMAMAREFGIDPQAAADRQTKLAGQKAEARGRRVDEQEANLEDFIRSRGVYGKEQEAEARQEIEGLAGKKLDAKSFALIQAGLAILSADPSRGAFSAIGEGAAKGLMGYKGDLEKLDEKREKINGRLDRILELRRLETTADGKDRLALKNERSMLEELALDDHREIAGNLDKSKEGLGTTLFNAHIRQREAELNRKARRNDELAMQRMSLNALNSRRILLQGQLKTAQTAFDEAEIDRINAALTDLDRELQTRGGMGSASGAGGGTLSQADQDLINRYSTAP